MRPALPFLLTFNGGYVDTAGFLALQGLFTAHVTGNFVTLGASLIAGTSGVLTKLLALPVFCSMVLLVRLLGQHLARQGRAVVRTMLAAQLLLLTAGALLAIALGPFPDGDAWPALATGLVLVAAMAVQNAVHRSHLGTTPPSTLMTGTTTQIMTDLADLLREPRSQARDAIRSRLARSSAQVAVFALGCAAAALAYATAVAWCFALPPAIAFGALLLSPARPEAGTA